jgi:type I restriction enzyme S subunit
LLIGVLYYKKIPNMNGEYIPLGWKWKKLKDVVTDFKRGPFGSAIKKSFFVPSGYKVYEQKNAIYGSWKLGDYFLPQDKFEELSGFEVVSGDYIVSCSGTIGRIYRIPQGAPKGVINQALLRIRINESEILPAYFQTLFESEFFQRMILVETRGSAMVNITGVKELKEISIRVPPLPVQRQIVTRIEELFSELDAGMQELQTALKRLKTYRQSVLQHYLSNEEWERVKLGDVVQKVFDGPFGSNLKTADYIDEPGYQVIRLENIGTLKFISDKQTFIRGSKFNDLEKHEIHEGDIVFSSFISDVIRTVVVPKLDYRAINKADCFCVRVDMDRVDQRFLVYSLRTQRVYKMLALDVHGATRPRINTTQLKSVVLNVPDLKTQRHVVEEIEAKLSEADAMETTIYQSLKQVEALRQSILKQAFEGKLAKPEVNVTSEFTSSTKQQTNALNKQLSLF